MIDRRILASAYLLDWMAGDPEWFPHPVRLIGKTIEVSERILRHRNQSPAQELFSGTVLSLGLIAATYTATARTISWAYRRSYWIGFSVETLLAWTCLASRNLYDEASSVIVAIESEDIALARQRLARIVGRDTLHLDTDEICRAVIETVAESASDGIIAPLLYLTVGGAPLAMAFKAANTLDSMIGHTDQRYFYFGKTAARLDDIANLIPSRLTALAIVATAPLFEDACFSTSITTWLRDGAKHKSPNAGQPESAMAGALQVRLGGENFYACNSITAPFLGAEFACPSVQKAEKAIRIVAAVSIAGAFAAMLWSRRKP